MELGALVCTAKNPDCDQCPVRTHCAARQLGLQAEIPGKVTKTKYESRKEYAFVVTRTASRDADPCYLMQPLPEGSRWAGLWDFPRTIQRSIDSAEEAAVEVSLAIGKPIKVGEPLTRIKHAVTKYRIELQVHHAELSRKPFTPKPPWKFVSSQEMADLPLSVTGRKIARLLSS